MKRFERLEDDKVIIRKGHKKRPFLIVREIKIKEKIGCYCCDLLGYCKELEIGKTMCSELKGLGIIETSIGITFKKKEG